MKPQGGAVIQSGVPKRTGGRMYSCKDSIDLLVDFLDGALSEDDERHLASHFSACPPCVDFLRDYKATTQLCRRALASKMPEELSQKLTDFLREKAKSPSS